MDWLGATITDPDGRPYARLDDLFVGRSSGRPEFGIVTLRDGQGRVAVPLDGAHPAPDGSLVLGVEPARVLDAPRMQRDVEEIPAGAGDIIRRHFGLEAAAAAPAPAEVPGSAAPTRAAPAREFAAEEAPTEVVRHEEQLTVATRAEATERVRVRKRVVTEDVTLTVTLRREELVIERQPLAEGEAEPASAFAEEGSQAEFVLHAEEPVVTKRVVPVERVRLHREISTEERQVTDTIRKELVDIDELPPTREDSTP